MLEKTYTTHNAEETVAWAKQLGANLRGGEVIELRSDLGGGKTTLTRGLARGFGSVDHVASPTFTVSKVYKSGNNEIHHFDFYRLTEPGIISHELHDLLGDPHTVVVVEWGDVVAHVLSKERLTIEIQHSGEEKRLLKVIYPNELSYLLERV